MVRNIVFEPRLIRPYGVYDELAGLARHSFRKYMAGEWDEYIHWKDDWTELWKSMFYRCRDFSRSGANVFVIGADTIAVKPIQVFGKYNQLTMFWHTDPPARKPFPGYMNSELLYIPAHLDERLWRIGEKMVVDVSAKWDYDRIQVIWNHMFWAQKPVPTLEPEMHWSPEVPSTIAESEARIIHFHASRGPEKALAEMTKRAAA